MKPSNNFFNIIVLFEGLKTKAYLDSANIWTIGIGTTVYPCGEKVKKGDTCTEAQAFQFMEHDISYRVKYLNNLLEGVTVTQNQFDALLSLMYNIGAGALAGSSVMIRVKQNPNDPAIRESWMKWNKARVKGVLQEVKGLTNRRKKEIDLYFKK